MGGSPGKLLDGIGDLMIPERRNTMDKKLAIITIVLTLIIVGIIISNQRTLYKDNERLLKMVEQSEAIADGYKESYETIKFQYDKIEKYYEKEIAIYMAISKRDDKVIEMLENKLEDEKIKYEILLDAYNEVIGNK